MANWETDVAELKTDVKYIREDINIMQKQIRDLSVSAHMGMGGLKVALFIGAILGGVYTFMKFLKQEEIMGKLKGMWKDLSKPGKVFVAALVIIAAIILVNYVI